MKFIITVIGKDRVGIVADVSVICKDNNININDISQKVFDDTFAMVMEATISDGSVVFSDIVDKLTKRGEELGLKIHVMHEDIFRSMHRI